MAGVTAVTTVAAHAAATGCQVTYAIGSQWTGGFSANVTIKNLGDPLTGWSLRWNFDAGQAVAQAWGAGVTQGGSAVTAANVSWNGSVATGGTASFGFNGTWNGTANPVPAAFTLNGVACTGGVTASPSPSPSATPSPAPTRSPGTPAPRTVRVFWLKPSDVAYDQRYPNGIANVMREAQRFFKQRLGKTFTLNDPVVEVVNGDQPRSWYENTPKCGEKYWWTVCNMQEELRRRFGLGAPDSRWVNVGEISAEGDGAGGGGGNGWVILSGHDADGNAGINGPMNRWYGGMVHELGHAFGLPDATSTDGTCMSASFYSYPNCTFDQTQKNGMLNGPYGAFLS
ncbi:cellulose-binding domain-containing protein [Sphaerisporangium rufum]|uniref:cellulose-binding domain-containing protein n=1 Tax=Sphaerisporangium rufum TaxID=1381558 RepID=UPI001EF2A1D8|nr:cellulose-binding domain-containing protein [Sphaerisporangium rufum]